MRCSLIRCAAGTLPPGSVGGSGFDHPFAIRSSSSTPRHKRLFFTDIQPDHTHTGMARMMKQAHGPRSIAAIETAPDRKTGGGASRSMGEIAFVLAVTLVGGWLRFRTLGRDSLWFDEVFSALQAHLPFWDLLRSVRRDVHPPLYHLLLRGMLPLGDSETILRMPSAFFGTLSIPALYLLGRAWFSGSVGALAALLLAISPFHLWHSQDARMYTLLTFEGIASWYLFARLLAASRVSLWVGYVLVSGAILYTHYYGPLLLLLQSGVVVLLRARREIDSSFNSRWFRVQAGLVLSFVPWLAFGGPSNPFKALRWIETFHPLSQVGWAFVGLTSGYRGPYWEAIGLPPVPSVLVWIQGVLIFGVAVVGLVRDDSGHWRTPTAAFRERSILLCLCYFVGSNALILLISLYQPLLVPRYLLMTAPAFFLLVALGLSRLLPKRMIITGAALLALLFVPGVIGRLATPRTADYRGAAALIAREATSGDALLISDQHLHPRRVLEYYLRSHEFQFRWCPLSLRDTSLQATQGCLGEVRRVWVVSGEESGGTKHTYVQAALEAQFKSVRRETLHRARVFLYERR